jgi:O-methyltransferase
MFSKAAKFRLIAQTKDFLLASRLLQIFQPFNRLFAFLYNFNLLTAWVHRHKHDKLLINDFYRPVRNYDDRLKSFAAIATHHGFKDQAICYLEFGVANGGSFKWWMNTCSNTASRFYGFDTFEGLPEAWGLFTKGDMSYAIPDVKDDRGRFIKGIFQDTLNDFLFEQGPAFKQKRKVIHMDADLYSSTIFTLSQLYPYLQKGDIIMFDEFNVYGHEFMAYRYFTECFYIKLKLISAQNNFYHAAFEVE